MSQQPTTTLELHPKWKQAVKDFVDEGFAHGDVISDEWLCNALGLPAPDPKRVRTEQDFYDERFAKLRGWTKMKEALLEDHLMDFERVPKTGYRIVKPAEQTRFAQERFVREVSKATERCGLRLHYVDRTQLNAAQRKENADALAKLGAFNRMARKRLPAPF